MQCFWLSFAYLFIKDLKYNFIECSQYLIILFRVNKVFTFYRIIYVIYLNDYYIVIVCCKFWNWIECFMYQSVIIFATCNILKSRYWILKFWSMHLITFYFDLHFAFLSKNVTLNNKNKLVSVLFTHSNLNNCSF